MGIPVAKMQTSLVGPGDKVLVVTRTTRYTVGRRAEGMFSLTTNNPTKKSGVVEVVGAMDTRTGEIEEGVIESGKYMVFRHAGDGEWAIKTSLVTRIEVERKA
jgi:hypothetical protein